MRGWYQGEKGEVGDGGTEKVSPEEKWAEMFVVAWHRSKWGEFALNLP